jgi:hypothetical protein
MKIIVVIVLIDSGAGTGFFALLFSKKMKKGKVYAGETPRDLSSRSGSR